MIELHHFQVRNADGGIIDHRDGDERDERSDDRERARGVLFSGDYTEFLRLLRECDPRSCRGASARPADGRIERR